MNKFIRAAKEYISWVECFKVAKKKDIVDVHRLVLSLYYHAFELRYHPDAQELKTMNVEHEEWARIRTRLQNLPFDEYKGIFDPLDPSDNSIDVGSLSDDLADIYRDIKPTIDLIDTADPKAIEGDLKRHFEIHWSEHAISALKAMRQYLESNVWSDDI